MLRRDASGDDPQIGQTAAFTTRDLHALRPALVALAEEVGRFALDAQQAGIETLGTTWKDDRSPVTLADLEADRRIVVALGRLSPGIPVVSEEGALPDPTSLRGRAFWLVDPIDGTRGYAKGGPEWTVNIALIDGGRPVLGVVGQPAVDEIYSGLVGIGAWKKTGPVEETIAVRAVPAEGYSLVVSHRAAIDEEGRRFAYLTLAGLVKASSSLKFCRVAEGAADLYPRSGPTREWDTAAGHAILRAAGGEVLDPATGAPLAYTKPDWLNGPFLAVSEPLFDLTRL